MGALAGDVVSLNLCTDQLLALLAPDQIAALEPLARDPGLSFVAAQASALPTVRADAEAVLALHPRLVLAGRYGAQTTVALLRARGIPILQVADAASFQDVAAQVTRVAHALDADAKGRAMLAAMWQRLATIRPRRGTAVMWEAGGWTAGPGSFAAAVLQAAGLRNIGTGGRLGLEGLLALHPDLLVSDTPATAPSLATDLPWHPALRHLVRLAVNPSLLICPTPFSDAAVSLLSQ